MNSRCRVIAYAFILALSGCSFAAELSRVAAAMDSGENLELTGSYSVVPEGPDGAQVLRFDADFSGRIDLKAKGIESHDFDLLKVEVKADAHASLRFSLENYPEPGQLSHWYVLDSARRAFDWTTIWIDLSKPEEIKAAESYKGMETNDPSLRGLRFDGGVKDMMRAAQGTGTSMWLGRVRFCRKALDLDWNQAQFSVSAKTGEDLSYTYPLEITNKLDRPVTALVKLLPFKKKGEATAMLSQERVELAAKESKKIEAKITLSVSAAKGKAPLYCELFEARVEAEGVADSTVTILRSSDPIHLSVTVPLPEEKLAFPLLPRRKDVPSSVTGFDMKNAEALTRAQNAADALKPEDVDLALTGGGLFYVGSKGDKDFMQASSRVMTGMTACAFLYDATGEKKYLDNATAVLLRCAELFPKKRAEWAAEKYGRISAGIFAFNTLGAGWALGSMRSPYSMQLHGVFNDFDLLAAGMDAAAREKILNGFILPAAIQLRNHYFGMSNQQDVVNYPVLYAGLATRNWPLVTHAYSSEHGVLGNLAWGFDDDGLCTEGHYHTATVRPILWATELLYRCGIDLYDERLFTIIHSRAAEATNVSLRDGVVAYLDKTRFEGKPGTQLEKDTDGFHLTRSGTTLLRWKGFEVAMNWGKVIHRGALDRCALRIDAAGEATSLRLGGGTYSHDSYRQSILIVDENLQAPATAEILSVNVVGPVQHVQAASDKFYPGTTQTRTFALLDHHVLVVDRLKSDTPRTFDWCLLGAGDKVSLTLEQKQGSWTTKPDEKSRGAGFGASLFGDKHSSAMTNDAWQEGGGRLTMAAAPNTQVLSFRTHPGAFAGKNGKNGVPMLMVRRSAVKETDFIAFFSTETQSVERVPVLKTDGSAADAVGVKVALKNGKTFNAIVSYEAAGTEVSLSSGLKTKDRFASDYQP